LAAKFCAVCGKILNQDYAPLDSLWASYNLQRRSESRQVEQSEPVEIKELFETPRNGAAATAMAFVVYSLVPYLGILFCPGAILMGGIGLAVSYQKPQLGGRQTATYSICLGAIVAAIQVLLWWLLYLIPELKGF
jgi:ABC-type Fe3+ transport system permease subunit